MATAEAASALGPRYAPDDPTLPKPWKGLIDGSTGLLYYWNPETNITQYEKPAGLPPPLLSGPPSAGSMPKLAPIPVAHSMQPNGMMTKQSQQHMTQATPQEVQQISQLSQQHGHMAAQVSDQQEPQQQGSQLGLAMQHPGKFSPQIRPQMMQYPGQQMPQQPAQPWVQQPGQQLQQQTTLQMSQQLGQQSVLPQNSQMAQPQGHQYTHQQIQYTAYQQGVPPQGQQSSQQQTQHGVQGQQFASQQEYKAAIPKKEEVDFPLGNQTGVSPSNLQQTGGTNSMKTAVNLGHRQQFGGSSVSLQLQQPNNMVQLQQTGTDMAHHQHGLRFENRMGPQMMHNNLSNLPPFGLNMGYKDNVHGRSGNDYYFNGNKDGPVMDPQQPNLAALPMRRNQQETRMGGAPLQNVTPGEATALNAVDGHSMRNMYSHAGPSPNNSVMRPPFVGSPGVTNLSSAEVYCQQHEVSATGDNVPTPFMTFESSGFPPEILREVRYLLWRSICRTLRCYWHTYTCNNYYDFWRPQNGLLESFLGIF